MIRKVWDRDNWMLTPQPEHARLSSLIATMWNWAGEKVGDEVIQAIRRHDDGWKETEESLPVNAAGAPSDFTEMPAAVSTETWLRSSTLLEKEGKHYAAMLVGAHFLYFAEDAAQLAKLSPRAAIAFGKFIGQQRAIQDRCRAKLEESGALPSDEKFATDLRFLQVCDTLSILLCSDFTGEHVIENVPYLEGADTLTITRKSQNLTLTCAPLPFKKNLRDHVNAYLLSRKVYESAEDLKATLQATKVAHNEVHIGAA